MSIVETGVVAGAVGLVPLCVPAAELTAVCFFFNDTATTEIYTLSLHDALPISRHSARSSSGGSRASRKARYARTVASVARSEEHTSELQSRRDLVCRLLLE